MMAGVQPAAGAGPEIDGNVRAEYPAILEAWATGQHQQALARLDALESSLIRSKKAERDIKEFWVAKLGVIRETMARSSADVLVPIMLLHHDAYRHYLGKRSSWRTSTSRPPLVCTLVRPKHICATACARRAAVTRALRGVRSTAYWRSLNQLGWCRSLSRS